MTLLSKSVLIKCSSFDEALCMLANLGPGAQKAHLDTKTAFRLLQINNLILSCYVLRYST